MMQSTLVQHGSGYGLTFNRKDPAALEITHIDRVENYVCWKRYAFHRQSIRNKYSQIELKNFKCSQYMQQYKMLTPLLDVTSNEYYLFHGTNEKILELLVKDGFDERVSNVGGMFGAGVYFAENSSKSNQYIPCPTCGGGAYFTPACSCSNPSPDTIYKILICRVTLGDSHICTQYDAATYKGNDPSKPCRRAPVKAKGGSEVFDSIMAEKIGVGSPAANTNLKFREVIVYDRNLIYGEYIVSYKRRA